MRRLYSFWNVYVRFEYPQGVQMSDRPLFSYSLVGATHPARGGCALRRLYSFWNVYVRFKHPQGVQVSDRPLFLLIPINWLALWLGHILPFHCSTQRLFTQNFGGAIATHPSFRV
jgi:hypothetical protein